MDYRFYFMTVPALDKTIIPYKAKLYEVFVILGDATGDGILSENSQVI